MPTLDVVDAGSATVSLGVGSGAGSSGDPFYSPAAVRLGATNDAAVAAGGGTGSVIAQLRRIILNLEAVATGIAKAEDAAHSSGHTGAYVLAVRSDTAASTAGTDGDYNSFITDASGRLWINAGVVTPGTAAGNLGKAEDAAHSSGDTGVMSLAVRNATCTDLSAGNTDGDYEPLQVSAAGRLWTSTVIDTALPAGSNAIGKLAANAGVNIGEVSLKDISACEYETVAASQTAQVLGATGGTGDYLAGLLVIPATTSPGNVVILDNATSITVFTGGASSVSNLVPFFIPLGMISVSGAWKVTTGSNVSVIGIGNFT